VDTPLTPPQQELEDNLDHVPTFKEVKEEVKDLREGQQEIKSIIEEEKVLNKVAFDKGAAMFDDLYREVGEMKKQISDGFKELGTKITDNEISRLERSLDKREDELKINDKRTWDTTKLVITAILAIIGTVLLTKFGM